ncbi:MAG: exodeoxyribonuclease VII large subunit [Halobacteria archaeon]
MSVQDERGEVLSVSEVNQRIEDAVDHLSDLKVKGEVTDFNKSSGMVFFNLVENLDSGEEKINCCMYKPSYKNLDVELEDGKEVLVECDLSYYKPRSRIQLKPHEIEVVGEGDRKTRVEKLKQKLRNDGYFEERHKLGVPEFPGRIAVVTSYGSEACRDVVDTVHGRHPDVDIDVWDTRVQGEGARFDIVGSLDEVNEASVEYDVVVLVRGGGSDDDLMPFNTEIVAKFIYHIDLPIVTGIGHEGDEHIADLVADLETKTPTDAAQKITPNKAKMEEKIEDLNQQLNKKYITYKDRKVSGLQEELKQRYNQNQDRLLKRKRSRLKNRYGGVVSSRLQGKQHRLYSNYSSYTSQELQDKTHELTSNYTTHIDNNTANLEHNLESGYQTYIEAETSSLEYSLHTSYNAYIDEQVDVFTRTLKDSYREFVGNKVDSLENGLSRGYRELEVEEEKERIVESEGRAARRYKVLAVILALLLLGVTLYLIL